MIKQNNFQSHFPIQFKNYMYNNATDEFYMRYQMKMFILHQRPLLIIPTSIFSINQNVGYSKSFIFEGI